MSLGWYLWNSKHADESTGAGVHAKTYTHAAWSTPATLVPLQTQRLAGGARAAS